MSIPFEVNKLVVAIMAGTVIGLSGCGGGGGGGSSSSGGGSTPPAEPEETVAAYF